MTIASTVRRNDYTGTGSTGPYPYTFRITAATDLLVTTRNLNGVEAVVPYPGGYTVAGVGEAAGSITLTTALTIGWGLVVERVVPLTQETEIRNQGEFFAETHEDVFDKLTMIDQQQQAGIDRAVKGPSGVTLGAIAPFTALDYLRVNAAGTGIETVSVVTASQNFLQSGAGAVLRTANAKMADVIHVRDFSVVGDGIADDAAALQAAINAVAVGGMLVVGPGMYSIGTALTIPRGMTITAWGLPTFKARSAMTQILSSTDQSDVAVEGIIFDANNLALNCVAFYSTAASPARIRVERCRFTKTPTDDTLNYGGLLFLATGGSISAHRTQDITIRNNVFLSLGTDGFNVAYADYVVVEDNTIDTTHDHGGEVQAATHILIRRNVVRNTGFDGVVIGAQSRYFTITENDCTNCAPTNDAAIAAENTCAFGSIVNNRCSECNTPGVALSFADSGPPPNDKVQSILIANNTVRAKATVPSTVPGINVYSSTGGGFGLGVIVEGNTIDGFAIGVSAHYFKSLAIRKNTITNQPTVASSMAIQVGFCTYTRVEGNICDSITGDHAIQFINAGGGQCDWVVCRSNTVFLAGTAGAKALCYFEGTGTVEVADNLTGGAANWVSVLNNAAVVVKDNVGGLTSTAVGGAGTAAVVQLGGNFSGLTDTVVIAGRKVAGGTGVPTTGTWTVGDLVLNTSGTIGQPKAWTCTVSGTFGGSAPTFTSQGNL